MNIGPDAVAYVVYGPSQVGKSSLIKCMRNHTGESNGDDPRIGTGMGRSVTSSATVFSMGNGLVVVDLGGWNDTELRFTGEEMAQLASAELAAKGIKKVKFIVFDSLASDTIQLRQSVAELVTSFGEATKNHILVVATKVDRVESDGDLQERLDYMRDLMTDLGIGNRLVTWQSKNLNDELYVTQSTNFRAAMDLTPHLTTDLLEDLNARILARAQEMCYRQEPRKITREVEENYVEERHEWEPYEEIDWVMEKRTSNHLDNQMRDHTAYAVGRHFLTLGIGTLIAGCRKDVHYVPVKKTATKHKWVTYYDNRTRMVKHEIEEDLNDVEYYLPQARQTILLEVRSSLKGN